MTPEAAQSEISPANTSSAVGLDPLMRNCCTTRLSEPGGTIRERPRSMVFETNRARLSTRIVAAEVSTGKNESSAEYAAPFAVPRQLSLNAETKLRRSSLPNESGVSATAPV